MGILFNLLFGKPKKSHKKKTSAPKPWGESSKYLTSNQVVRKLEILQDSVKILDATVNPDTFFSRLALVIDKLSSLKVSQYIKPYSDILRLETEKDSIITAFIYRYWEHTCQKANSLKTDKGKQNCYKRFYESLSSHDNEMNEENIALYHTLYLSKTLPGPDFGTNASSVSTMDDESSVEYIPPTPLKAHFEERRFQQNVQNILNSGGGLDELNQYSYNMAQINYQRYSNEINNVNPLKLDLSTADMGTVSSAELLFLDYLDGMPINNPPIAQKWYYEYGLNYEETIKKLLAQGYLELSHSRDLSKCTVAKLKEILSQKNLPRSGRKAELIERIISNFTEEEYQSEELYYHKIEG